MFINIFNFFISLVIRYYEIGGKNPQEIKYSIDSWNGNFFIHTNLNAEDFKICICKHENIENWKDYIPASNGVLIGGFILLNKWMIRSEVRDALSRLYIRNLNTNTEENLVITNEKVISSGISLMKKNRDTNEIYVAYHSPKTPGNSYTYNV